MDFRVDLNIFRGPLDLLLFLVRKHEVEITEIPIAPITEQFLQYLAVLKELDVDGVGDFVEMASTLIEIKSRTVLPHGDEAQEPLEDPRKDLVHQLLQYKRYKDAASMLEERGRQWQQRYPRLGGDLPSDPRNPAAEPIHEAELWDLVSAFGRILKERAATSPSNILYDDTPIQVYMERIHADLEAQRPADDVGSLQAVHEQIDAGRIVPGHAGTGAASRRALGAKRTVRRDLDSARRRRCRSPRLLPGRQLPAASASAKAGTSSGKAGKARSRRNRKVE